MCAQPFEVSYQYFQDITEQQDGRSQLTFTFSKSTIKMLEKCVK